jgi:hypothetical protein
MWVTCPVETGAGSVVSHGDLGISVGGGVLHVTGAALHVNWREQLPTMLNRPSFS